MYPPETEADTPSTKTILIVDDHPMLRRGLAALIESEPDLAVSGEAATYAGGLEAVEESPPRLVVIDIELQEGDGLDLVKEIKKRHPQIPVLVLTMHDETVYAERSLRAGARGYVTKQELDDTVLVAIRRLLDGEMYLSPRLEARLARKYVGGKELEAGSPVDALTDRELQVFRLIGQGRTTRQIAEGLFLSVKTVERHRENIKHKLTIESSADLARQATNWVETGRG